MNRWESLGHGIEARKHPTRKHGVRFDRYFRGRYTLNGKTTTVAFGWESEGWTPTDCITKLAEFKEAARKSTGKPVTLKEEQRAEEKKRRLKEEARQLAEKESLTLERLFFDNYLPQAKTDKTSWDRDVQLFRIWIKPVIGEKRLCDISTFDLERVKKAMLDAGSSPRTIEYALAVVRHIFNFAKARDLYHGDNPVS